MSVEIPRGRGGRPKIYVEGAKQLVEYTRSSTLGKTLEETSNLQDYSTRITALGLARRPDLLALAARCTVEDRNTLNDLVEQAKEAGGGAIAAGLGTANHTLLEMHDRGKPIPILLNNDKHTISEWERLQREYGFSIDPNYIECFGVCDELEVAGTTDRLVHWHAYPNHLTVGDIKTGGPESQEYAQVSWAVQLAVYAHSVGYEWDGEVGHRTPIDINTEVGLVFHIPSDGSPARCYELDLKLGWDMAKEAIKVRQYRSLAKKGIRDARTYTPPPAPPVDYSDMEQEEEYETQSDPFNGLDDTKSVAQIKTENADAKFQMAKIPAEVPEYKNVLKPRIGDNFTKVSDEEYAKIQARSAELKQESEAAFTLRTRAWVEARMEPIRANPEAVQTLAKHWPTDMPTLKQSQGHTLGQLLEIAALIDDVCAHHQLAFSEHEVPPKRHVDSPVPATPAPAPRRDKPDECGVATDEVLKGIATRFTANAQVQAKVQSWINEAEAGGNKIGLMLHKTQRRANIVATMCMWAEVDSTPAVDDVARAAIKAVVNFDEDSLDMTQPVGVLFSHLTNAQAMAVGAIALVLDSGELVLEFDEQGASITGDALDSILTSFLEGV